MQLLLVGLALNFEATVLAPLVILFLDLTSDIMQKRKWATGTHFAEPLWNLCGTGSQLSRISGTPSARSPPHLEEGGARPRCDVTAPGTGCGRLGGARGLQGAWPGSPDHSREISPQPGPDSLHTGPLASTSISNVARSASERVGAGCPCETPRVPQPTASGSRPGAWLSAHCAQARIPLAPACWRRGRGRA